MDFIFIDAMEAHQAALSLTISLSLPKFMSVESLMLSSSHLILLREIILSGPDLIR